MTDYEVLLKEVDAAIERWHARLDYHGKTEKSINDIYVCSSILYELENIKARAHNTILEQSISGAATTVE